MLIAKKMLRRAIILIVAIVVVAIAALLLLATQQSSGPTVENLSGIDQYANLGNASFALVAPHSILSANGQFASLAMERYDFRYADAANFTNIQNSTFIVIVVNSSNDAYGQLALKAINITELDNALNYTKGAIISKDNVWGRGQTVFLLIGYNTSSLSSSLSSFFVKSPVYAPKQVSVRFVNESGKAPGDPVMDAVLDGTYELGPHDSSLPYPYNYYENFAYLIYYAPVITSAVPGFEGNSSGTGLPMFAPACVPPPPPPEGGSSICVGDYAAMPIFQIESEPPLRPQWSYDTGDCNFFGIDDCIDAEGWAASGLNPQLPYGEIPSVYFGVTSTGSPVPPSMDGTFGPVSDSLPITWWVYGPDSYGESTGGFQSSMSGVMNESETALLIDAGVQMFSAPIGETPVGNFTVYNATNSSYTYSCGSEICGMKFNYTIYALLNVSSTIPSGASVMSPHGYSPEPQLNYSPVLEPLSLSAPKIVKTSTKTYYFSYWSVYSELAGNQYYNRYNTSNVVFQLIGPTQAQAIYTTAGPDLPGSVNFTAATAINFCAQGICPISGVNITFRNLSSGRIAYSNITGSSTKFYTTPQLASGCYNVSAYEAGYIFYVTPDPVCVNGNGALVEALDKYLYVFNVSWPSTYPLGAAPINKTLPIKMSLDFYNGRCCAGAVPLKISTTSGSLSSVMNGIITIPPTSSGNGTVHFLWYTGRNGGPAKINFTVNGTRGLFISNYTYSMPVELFSRGYPQTLLSINLSNGTVHAFPGMSFTDNIIVRLCHTFGVGSNRTLPCSPIIPYTTNLSLTYMNDRPANTTISFVPNPAPANTSVLYDSTSLHVSLGRDVMRIPYVARIKAVMSTPNATYNATVPLLIYVSTNSSTITTTIPPTNAPTTTVPNGSGYGALNITIFFNGAPAATAEVDAFSPGIQTYTGWYTGSNGEYDTGYIIAPGSYEVDGTYDNITNSTNYLNVSAGKVTYVNIYIYGAVNTTTTSLSSTTTTTSMTSDSSTSIISSSTTTVQSGYYECNYCYQVVETGFTCPSTCPTLVSCSYGGFKCT